MNNSFTKQCIQQLRRVTDQFSESYRGKKEKSHFATQSQMIKSGIQKLKVFKKRKKSEKKKEKRQSPKGKKKKKKQETCGEPVRDTVHEPLELPKTLLSKIFNNNLTKL